ncbi:hypothetical protein AWV80_18045 [Cupriavidus sp. UYMU48A]|nr:hypothetical protein AWV80_18045 [Cupriavidus sp. UYMU48A]
MVGEWRAVRRPADGVAKKLAGFRRVRETPAARMFRETCGVFSGPKERVQPYACGADPDHVPAESRRKFRCHSHPRLAPGIRAKRDQHRPVVHQPLPGNRLPRRLCEPHGGTPVLDATARHLHHRRYRCPRLGRAQEIRQ